MSFSGVTLSMTPCQWESNRVHMYVEIHLALFPWRVKAMTIESFSHLPPDKSRPSTRVSKVRRDTRCFGPWRVKVMIIWNVILRGSSRNGQGNRRSTNRGSLGCQPPSQGESRASCTKQQIPIDVQSPRNASDMTLSMATTSISTKDARQIDL